MPGRKRMPAVLQEQSRGRIHRTRAEVEERKEREEALNANLPDAEPPEYLTDPQKIDRFNEIVALTKMLPSNTLAKAMDADAIAAYIDAQMNYEYLQGMLEALQAEGAPLATLEGYTRMRNAAQVQCDKLRATLALDPLSRLKLVCEPEGEKHNKFEDL